MEKSSELKFGVTVATEVGATIEGLFEMKTSMSSTFESTSSETWRTE